LREIEIVLARKAPQSRPYLALLLDRARVQVSVEARAQMLEQALSIVAYPGDAQVLAEALSPGAVVLLHSPRAARHFARWCDADGARRDGIALVAISNAALAEAGPGWAAAAASPAPSDAAMLAAAANVLGGERAIR